MISEYLAAIAHWEIVLSQTYQAYCLLDMGQKMLFASKYSEVLWAGMRTGGAGSLQAVAPLS